MEKPRLSLCMMVRDEERLLAQAIDSVRPVVDEIVVVDTGSTDRTREIAAACGAQVFEHAWDDSFGRGRNAYLRHATGDWVLVLDGDEKIAARDLEKLRDLMRNPTVAGYRFQAHNYTRSLDLLCDWHPNSGAYPEEEALSQCPGHSRFRVVRLFRRTPDVRYEEGYSTHTNPVASLRPLGEIADADVVVHHFQCLKGGERFVAGKQRQRLALEQRHLELFPNDALAHLNVGRTLFALGRDDEALVHLDRAVDLGAGERALLSRGIARFEWGDYDEAASDLRQAVQLDPGSADAWTVLGMAAQALEDPEASAAAFRRALQLHPDHPLALNSFGVLLAELGEHERAEAHYRQALAILPEHPVAGSNLAALLAERGRSDEALDEAPLKELGDEGHDV